MSLLPLLVLAAKAVLLGVAIAAPLGPIGTLCINRTVERGFWGGFSGGLGTALADATYAGLAAAGFAAFSGFLGAVDAPLRLVGGLFVIWLGWRGLRPRPGKVAAARVAARDLLGTLTATYLLTLANPATILSFAAIFAGLGLVDADDRVGLMVVVVGVFAGSLMWWLALSATVAVLRHKLPDDFSRWIARLSGGLLVAFGAMAILSLAPMVASAVLPG